MTTGVLEKYWSIQGALRDAIETDDAELINTLDQKASDAFSRLTSAEPVDDRERKEILELLIGLSCEECHGQGISDQAKTRVLQLLR